ncbi:MAG: peptidase M10A and M12B matrixin and adamalysin [Demequinaceae bacterium]|nr:peptidase M10A and M12B matrixin and adamalysin [Demequinaceae bacterium]
MTSRAKFWLSFLFLVLVAVVYLGASGMTWTDIQNLGTPRNALIIEGEDIRIPLPEDSDGRVLPVVEATTSGAYSFMFMDGDTPVLWDPCRPIHYVINPTGAPPGGEALIRQAIASVSEATGLSFYPEGLTSEVASFDRALIQEDVYGERFVPFIIGWSTETDLPELQGSVAGLGGSSSVPGAFGDQRFLQGGVVVLDAPDLAKMMSTEEGRALALAVIMHEIGHVVGLGHVDDALELMNPSNSNVKGWGPGDLQGLALAGAGACQGIGDPE